MKMTGSKVIGTKLLFILATIPALVLAVEPDNGDQIVNVDGSATIRIDASHTFASAFLDSDTYTSQYTLNVLAQHRGKTASVYLGGIHNDDWYIATPSGWQPWNRDEEEPIALGETVLQESVEIPVLTQDYLPNGEFEIYVAYQVAGEPPVIGEEPLRFTIQAADEDTLHRFNSDQAMEDFIKQGLASSASNQFYATADFEKAVATDGDGPPDQSGRVSTTNLQESGVDEADIMKSDGEHLLMLRSCLPKTCVVTYELDSENALAIELASVELEGTLTASGMYLVKGREDGDRLVTIGSSLPDHIWLDLWSWTSSSTQLEFFDATDPAQLDSLESLTIDGTLISSRRVGDTLFLVTRHTPFLEGYAPYAYDEQSLADNSALLNEAALADLLPKVIDSQEQEHSLIAADKCYLPTANVDRSINPTIVTVTAMPLSDPTGFSSTCFIGQSETLYMTPDSLYLATTQFQYANIGFERLFYQPEHSTAIHKFALTEEGIDYSGSGQVKGHLGWSEGKKSFRMGENEGFLNVVTSIGTTWDGTSSTVLTVLREAEEVNSLEIVDTIEGIGKPGEQLYAARFLGDRAYLVTFLLTDPLYVVDLSDQENPAIAGELEIEGYSDYLHPVSENLLLGIGKDAVADENSPDFNGTRGAWYQGVKLSLFDVADPSSPTEINSIVLGRRGTQSEVLYDHHALTFLPATDNEPARVAIPVDLHDTVPNYEWFDPDSPNAFYDYTYTGLYSFEIDENEIRQAGLIYGTEPGSSGTTIFFRNYGDRSVLVDDAVFYLHGGDVVSSFWGQNP